MRTRIERASRVRAPVMCPTIKRPWLSRMIYIGGSRASVKRREIYIYFFNIYIYFSTGILLLATELPAAVCHVYFAATQPHSDPDGQRSISSSSAMTPSRARNVLNKLCQSESRCLESCLSYMVLVPAAAASRNLRYIRMSWHLRCISPALRLIRMISPHASVEEATEIDRERSSVVLETEIDFALVATDVPPINHCGQISGFARVSVSPFDFYSVLLIITLSGMGILLFFLRCIQSDVNILVNFRRRLLQKE